jgi:hypothetical protein
MRLHAARPGNAGGAKRALSNHAGCMARTLETLDLGTPVFCGEVRVGDVRGLYAEGAARSVEWVVVDWAARGEIAVPAIEIGSVDDHGVTLLNADVRSYDSLPEFSEERFPTVRKLA